MIIYIGKKIPMLKVEIREEETIERLSKLVKTALEPHVREKASAILKVHGGTSATQVARCGLLQERHPETIRTWVHNFNTEGIASFYVESGRGRKAAFFPSV